MRDGDLRAMKATTYSDPYSGQEFLVLPTPSGELVGMTYDPRSSSTPVAWRSSCDHCRSGRSHLLAIHSKREIQLLCSRRSLNGCLHYVAPANTTPLDLVLTETSGLRTIVVTSLSETVPDHVLTARARPPWRHIEYEGDRRRFQSPILLRSLKFILSARTPTEREICACLSPLLVPQPAPRGRSNPCKKIDWSSVMKIYGGGR